MAKGKPKFLSNITFGQIAGVIFGVFVLIQILFKISHKLFNTADQRFGWVFQFGLIALLVILLYIFIVTKKADLSKKDFFVLVFLGGAVLALTIFLPKFLPEIFSITFPTGTEQLQSFIGQAQSFLGGK